MKYYYMNTTKKLMTSLLALIAAHSALAYDFEVDGLYYNINVDSTLTVTRGLEKYSGDIIIPNTVVHDGKTYTVSDIGYAAFASSDDLTSVVMGDSIKHIISDSFSGSKNLKNVTLNKSVLTIGSYAFAGCSSLTQFTIPDAVTKINEGTFMGCSSLASVTIGDGVTAIGYMSFSDCSCLSEINFGRSVACIGEDAFNNCTGLKTVNIGPDIITIPANAFSGTSSDLVINLAVSEGAVANAPWGATNATINYDTPYAGTVPIPES